MQFRLGTIVAMAYWPPTERRRRYSKQDYRQLLGFLPLGYASPGIYERMLGSLPAIGYFARPRLQR